MRSATIAGCAAVALLGVAGCGGDSQVACDLLTRPEAAEILDVATRPGTESDDTPVSNCSWISRDSSTEPQAAVYGLSILDESGTEARAEFDSLRDESSSIFVIEPVEGLGDEAYYVMYTEPTWSGQPSLPRLSVRVGDRILDFGVFDSDDRPVGIDEARRFERAVADLAVERVGG